MGIDMILFQVAADTGTRLVVWTYDKVKRFWKPDVNATNTVLQIKDQSELEMSPLRQANLDDRFAAVRADPDDDDIAEFQASRRPLTPEEKAWAQRNKDDARQPAQVAQPQPGTFSTTTMVQQPQRTTALQQHGPVTRPKSRIEAGKQMIPVHDNDYYNNDDHDDNHDPHKAVLERNGRGKHEDRLQKMVEEFQEENRTLKADAQTMSTYTIAQAVGQTTGPGGPQHAPWTKDNDPWPRDQH